jgi:hypothetical protein
MNKFSLLRARACCVALVMGGLVGAGVANAGFVETHTSEPFGELTDWTHVFQLPQFDDQDGSRTLLSVIVTLDTRIDASAEVENLESWEHTITMTLDSSVSLSFLDEPLVAPTGVENEQVFEAAPFDGMIDFAGPSGGGFDMGGIADASSSRSGADDLSPWIGQGDVDIVGNGVSVSSASGPGNVLYGFDTQAFGQVTVRYEYVPTPGAWAILAASGVALVPRKRRAHNA